MARTTILLLIISLSVVASSRDVSEPPSLAPAQAPAPAHHRRGHHPHGGHHKKHHKALAPSLAPAPALAPTPALAPAPALVPASAPVPSPPALPGLGSGGMAGLLGLVNQINGGPSADPNDIINSIGDKVKNLAPSEAQGLADAVDSAGSDGEDGGSVKDILKNIVGDHDNAGAAQDDGATTAAQDDGATTVESDGNVIKGSIAAIVVATFAAVLL